MPLPSEARNRARAIPRLRQRWQETTGDRQAGLAAWPRAGLRRSNVSVKFRFRRAGAIANGAWTMAATAITVAALACMMQGDGDDRQEIPDRADREGRRHHLADHEPAGEAQCHESAA